ncbi:MAG: hypothetical protein HY081_11385 [Gammaproteobacteria bacterium]|nr:hypothetical protein [Gammaproteobacteria bacterium]
MNSLDRAVELVLRWKANRQIERNAVLENLQGTIKDCQTAIQVWQGYLDKPGAAGDQRTIISWIGPERAKQLFDINLNAKQKIEHACHMAGPDAGRFIMFDENIIELAYRQLKPDETGPDAAKNAIQQLQARSNYLGGLIERIRSTKPASGSVKSATKKTAVKKINKAKKSPKKATKKKAPAKK